MDEGWWLPHVAPRVTSDIRRSSMVDFNHCWFGIEANPQLGTVFGTTAFGDRWFVPVDRYLGLFPPNWRDE